MVRFIALNSIFLFQLAACQSNQPDKSIHIQIQEKNPWTNGLDFSQTDFRFAIISDRTAIPTPGVFESAIEKINYLRPDFVMSVGDLVEGYTLEGPITDLRAIDRDWNHITSHINRLEMPFFYTVGNNDINSHASYNLWERRFGRSYYSFRYNQVLFIVLNTDDPPGSRDGGIGNKQLQWIKEVLISHSDASWTFIFMHRPLWLDGSLKQPWDSISTLFPNPHKTTVFAGHITAYNKEIIDGVTYYVLSKTGSFSTGNRPPGDDFDHITWVSMTSSGPVIANLMLDGIWSDDPNL